MFESDAHIGRSVIRRGEIVEVIDDGDLQLVIATGLHGETIKSAHRSQYFGSSENPPVGSHGQFLLSNGRPDQAYMMAAEHPDHRPRNTGAGEKVLYNAHGDVISIVKQNIRIVTPKFTVEAATIELKGDIQHTGDMNTSGVHTDSNGVHA
jgi:phage baseplate assembly protein V